jgi:hypothetical protein
MAKGAKRISFGDNVSCQGVVVVVFAPSIESALFRFRGHL